ncbi:MAG TPA: metallophosphoesterase family protein [Rhodocyclaceae bacterium]|nr:metallophosphoesterase family protein [Rhodocyclaceae bacterium]
MRIGVVSDTHMPRFAKALPLALCEGLAAQRVERILHLGDFTTPAVAELFARIAPFDAVAGNNDPPELVARFGRRKIVVLDGVRIGLVHGDGRRGSTLERAIAAFAGDAVDVIVFGHSHVPYCARHGDRWLLNPGSPTDKRRNPRYSWALLELDEGGIRATLQFYEDKRWAE